MSQLVKDAARRFGVRAATERTVDSARLLIDSLSDPVYQPVEELGHRYAAADRAAGTKARWSAMTPTLEELRPRTALDIGCNAGWFTLELGRSGIATVGVDSHPPAYRTAITAVKRSGLTNVGILTLLVTPATVDLLPVADVTLLLSVWHHVVNEDGMEAATAFLQSLWSHTRMVMFFDTGEPEEFAGTDFRLPDMGGDAEQWLAEYLTAACAGSEVQHLGRHPSGGIYVRNLFAIRRTSPARVQID